MPNRLADQSSPYLLQHADNPVDWYPWGPEAFQRAQAEDKPIFLSIGYASCHWCHVMAHECFENPEIAELLNEHFVSIKVDREEHPEIDQIYMESVQRLTGYGGWPLSVFLTPGLEPFFGGTYWPPEPRGPMPGFPQVLWAVAEAWQTHRAEALEQAHRLTELLREDALPEPARKAPVGPHLLDEAWTWQSHSFDPQWGGFGEAPKFPHALDQRLLLRRFRRFGHQAALDMVRRSLDRMAAGGIFDHLGGGFHRYSTDAAWLVPHFEKMLYDNAMLALCYLEAWEVTRSAYYAGVARQTLDYILRDLADPAGPFYSSEDADSEGGEGRFYLWDPSEIRALLPPEELELFGKVYAVTVLGQLDGGGVLHLIEPFEAAAERLGVDSQQLDAQLARCRKCLWEARSRRPRPGKDDKVLVAWNGLAIEALAQAGKLLGEPRYIEAAQRAAQFMLAELRTPEGGLWHTWRRGKTGIPGLLDDYAALANGLIALHEATGEVRWLDEAAALADQILARFADPARGGFFLAEADRPGLLVRKKDMLDSATPSGGGLATAALLRLGKQPGREHYLHAAQSALAAATPWIEYAPMGMSQFLLALDASI